jgi:hypothetical protein
MLMVARLPVALRQDLGKLSEQALFRKLFVEIQNKQPFFGLTSYPHFTIQAGTTSRLHAHDGTVDSGVHPSVMCAESHP